MKPEDIVIIVQLLALFAFMFLIPIPRTPEEEAEWYESIRPKPYHRNRQ